MPGEAYGRMVKATDLEQIVVERGHRALTPDVKAEAVAALSVQRGRRMDASPQTWTLVERFLADRFPGR